MHPIATISACERERLVVGNGNENIGATADKFLNRVAASDAGQTTEQQEIASLCHHFELLFEVRINTASLAGTTVLHGS